MCVCVCVCACVCVCDRPTGLYSDTAGASSGSAENIVVATIIHQGEIAACTSSSVVLCGGTGCVLHENGYLGNVSFLGGSATRVRPKTEMLENSGRSEYYLKRRIPIMCGRQ